MINRTHYCFFLILWSQFVSIQNVTCFLVSLSNIWESPILRITYFSVTGESNAGVSQKWGPAKTYPPSPPHHHHLPPHICTWYIIIYLYIYIYIPKNRSFTASHPIRARWTWESLPTSLLAALTVRLIFKDGLKQCHRRWVQHRPGSISDVCHGY